MEPEERESAYRSYGGIIGLALMSVAILWILFHVVTAGIGTLPNYQQRAIHLGGALARVETGAENAKPAITATAATRIGPRGA